MVRRSRRSEMPPDPAAVVRALRAIHRVLVGEVLARTRPSGPTYRLAGAVLNAIDALADHLAGASGYFMEDGSSAGEDRKRLNAEKAARERGEQPWRP